MSWKLTLTFILPCDIEKFYFWFECSAGCEKAVSQRCGGEDQAFENQPLKAELQKSMIPTYSSENELLSPYLFILLRLEPVMDASVCATLSLRSEFSAYIELLRNATDNDFSLVDSCRMNVCGALWGLGNPDISGVGMAAGYLMESALCVFIVGASLWYEMTDRKNTLAKLLLSSGIRAYHDTASFFTFAIQVACIATLSKADWGLGADGMGGITKEITWLVSSLSLLPLMVVVLRPHVCEEAESVDIARQSVRGSHTFTPRIETREASDGVGGDGSAAITKARLEQRLVFFVVCWALAFCSFYSRMGGTFGKIDKRLSTSEG